MNQKYTHHSLTTFLFGLVLTFGLSLSVHASPLFQEAPPEEAEVQEEKSKDLTEKSEAKPNKADKSENDASESKSSSDSGKAKPKKDQSNKEAPKSENSKSDSKEEASEDGDKKAEATPKRRRRQSRAAKNSKSQHAFLDVFRPVISETASATVKIKSKNKTVLLGAIVDSGGYVLTKLSDLKSPLICELNDGKEVPAYIFGVHPETDLALLKIEAKDLPAISWAENDDLEIGHWLATVRDSDRPLKVGVVGVKARLIKPQSGFMGVSLQQAENGVRVTGVSEKSPAEKAGLKAGDIIQKVNGESFVKQNKLIAKVKSFPPGAEIRLGMLRNKNEIVADVVLGEERTLNPAFERSNAQNSMGGDLSRRRQNFPLAVQHDTFLKPEECGGPVVNLDGKVVGINIARQGRVSSLMLPAALARSIVDELKTGQWAPAIVNRSRIDEINRLLQELNTSVALTPSSSSLKDELKELKKQEAEQREALEEILKARIRTELQMENSEEKIASSNEEIKRLENELEELVTGSR